MEAFLQSFVLVFAGEMGDKTQLLALVLSSRFRKPGVIMAGIFFATLLNHALAAFVGHFASTFMDSQILKWILVLLFLGFGLWILIPDKEEELKQYGKWGAFLTTLVAFFLAEMGDKTQLATVALGARFPSLFWVTVGTTAGMMASNGIVVYLGDKILSRIPMKWVRVFACLLFLVFAAALAFGNFWQGIGLWSGYSAFVSASPGAFFFMLLA